MIPRFGLGINRLVTGDDSSTLPKNGPSAHLQPQPAGPYGGFGGISALRTAADRRRRCCCDRWCLLFQAVRDVFNLLLSDSLYLARNSDRGTYLLDSCSASLRGRERQFQILCSSAFPA
jgi:hypothetical protein